MWQDARFALRTLRQSPVFTAAAVVSLALGIGANTAIFSLLYQVAMRTLPVTDPARIVSLHSDYGAPGWGRTDTSHTIFSYPMYQALRDRNAVFTGVFGRTSCPVTLAWNGQSASAAAEVATGGYFEVLGVEPAIGRVIVPEDEARDHAVVVLGYEFWANRMGKDASILNRQIRMNGHPVLVVGVAPRGFRGVVSGQTPDLYAPASMMAVISPGWQQRVKTVDGYWLNLFARLRPGVSAQQANAALAPLFRAVLEEHLRQMSDVTEKQRTEALGKPLTVRAAAQGANMLRDQWQASLLLLGGIVALVLLIACANVASLLVVRAAVRQRELAIRSALGASGGQIARLLLAEAMALAVAGGAAGIFVCGAVTRGLLVLLPEDATGNWLSAQWDARVFAFSMGLAMLTGVLFGLVPALSAARSDPAPAIKNQNSGLTGGEYHSRSRQLFVAAQICVSFLLLVGAGLFTRTLANLMTVDPGFRADRVVRFSVDAVLAGYPRPQAREVYRRIEERLRAYPEVSSAAHAAFAPFSGWAFGNGVKAPGSRTASDKYVNCLENPVGADYFRTMGIALMVGREFDDRDSAAGPKVAVINESFARELFEHDNPIGRTLRTGSNDVDMQVVGVARDTKYGNMREKPSMILYVPYEQAEPGIAQQATFFVRAPGDERRVMAAAGAIVKQEAPGVPVERMETMRATLDQSMRGQRLIAILAAAFAGLAVLLAAIGVYGAATYSMARRRREFGIRLALGAAPGALLRAAMREVLAVTALGITAGLPLSYWLARLAEFRLYGVTGHDPLTLAGAAALIAVVAGAAALRPGVQVMRTDPVEALRQQ